MNKIGTKQQEHFVLVTGGAGFIGSHLVDKLIEMGERVLVLDDLSTGSLNNLNERAVFYPGKIEDINLLKKVFKQYKIKLIYHLAAVINEGIDAENSIRDATVSIVATINLLELSIKSGVDKFIFISSVSVYGIPKDFPVSESSLLNPINSYGVAKMAAENYVQYFGQKHGLGFQILRYGNIYGPRQPKIGEVGVVSVFMQKVLAGEKLKIYGDGRQKRDFLYVNDCIEMTIQLTKVDGDHIVNIVSGKSISVLEIFDVFSKVYDQALQVDFFPKTKDEIGEFLCTCEHYKKLVTKPIELTGIDQGIAATINHFIRN